ncbi:MAG: hypothetical protein FWE60_01530 [Oscillospiraceae bacterium]|nr:hypothetical protein [Oscillospiraceae bacterium]
MKKAKRLLGIILAAAFIAGLMAVPAQAADEEAMARVYAAADAYLEANSGNWADSKWLQCWDRPGDFCGADFMLTQMLDIVGDRATEGYYRFTYVVTGGHPRLGYPQYKIVTAAGNPANFGHLRFSDWYKRPFPNGKTPEEMTREEMAEFITQDVVVISYNDDRVDGHGNANTPTSGMIPADILVQAAAEGQHIRFSSQGDEFDFIIKEMVLEHFPDGQDADGVLIYQMSTDPVFQGLPVHSRFEGDGGMVQVAGSGSFRVVDKDTYDTDPLFPYYTDGDDEPGEEAADDAAGTAAPPVTRDEPGIYNAADDDSSDDLNVVLIIAIAGGALVLLIIIIAVVAKSKKK